MFLLFVWGAPLVEADIRGAYKSIIGAEHKTQVFAFENGDPLDTAAVQKAYS